MFFEAVNPMFIDHYREKDYDMTQPRIAVNKKQLENASKYSILVYLRVAQSKGLLFDQTRSNAIILYNTLPAMCIEKVVARKSGEDLYSKTYQSPVAPQRVANLIHERQDTTSSDARNVFRSLETCRCEIDFRIQGLRHSAVQEHDHIRKQAVQKLIQQFENHPNKEALQEDLQKNRAFNPSSEKSQKMIYRMGVMEFFEIYEISPNTQCSNCMTYWPKGIVYCTCGTCLRPLDKVRKLNRDATMFCQYPVMSLKRDHPMRDGTGIRKDRELSSGKSMKKEYKSIRDRFLICTIY